MYLKKYLISIILNLFQLNYIQCKDEQLEWVFLKDFFEMKNVKVTMNVCWSKEQIRGFYEYFFIETNNSNQLSIYQDVPNKRFFDNSNFNNYFVLDLENCEDYSWKLLGQANNEALFKFPLKYLLLTPPNFFNELITKLKSFSIFVDSDVIIAKKIGTFELIQPYRINEHLILENYGIWSKENGLVEYLDSKTISSRRKNLKQATIKLGLFIQSNNTWDHLEDSRFPNVDQLSKQSYLTIKALGEYLNIHLQETGFSDNQYYEFDQSKKSGLVWSVYKNDIDISGSPIIFIPERFYLADFIKMSNPMPVKIILKRPTLSFMRNIFILPFERKVWYALAVATALFFGILYVIMNWECKIKAQPCNRERFSTSDMVLLVLEAICQQGTVIDPKRPSGKISQFIMFLSFAFLYTSFSAFIIILLQSTVEIKSWQELLDSRLEVGGQNLSFINFYINDSQNLVHQRIYQKKIGADGFYSFKKGMEKVEEGNFAFHADFGDVSNYIMEHFSDYQTCAMQEIDGFFEHLKGYIIIPKNSPYKEIFKVSLMKMEELGIQRRTIHLYQRIPTCYSRGASFDSVGIIDTIQALLIWAYGLGLSVAILFVEIYVHKHKHRLSKIKQRFKNIEKNVVYKKNMYEE